MGQSYPLPITAAMLAPANPNVAKPSYDAAGAADWSMGAEGNDWDVATASFSLASASGGAAALVPAPRTQIAKASLMSDAYAAPAFDIGKDYGEFAGLTGRDGYITPLDPYGPPPEPEP